MELGGISIWYWIILALVGIISGILGYFFGRSDTPDDSESVVQLNILEVENSKLKSELDACKQHTSHLVSKPSKATSETLGQMIPLSKFDAKLAKMDFGKAVKENDLKIVEGIGPKIEGLFHNFKIKTWKELSETSADTCQKVLDSGGKRYRIHDPASWPMQAKMAYEGHWKQLADWQEKHRAGKY